MFDNTWAVTPVLSLRVPFSSIYISPTLPSKALRPFKVVRDIPLTTPQLCPSFFIISR